MPKRETKNENVRKIQHTNGSYYVTLPIGLVRELKWQERQKVTVKKRGKEIVIKDWKK